MREKIDSKNYSKSSLLLIEVQSLNGCCNCENQVVWYTVNQDICYFTGANDLNFILFYVVNSWVFLEI